MIRVLKACYELACRSRRAAPAPAITARRCRSRAASCSASPTSTVIRSIAPRPRRRRGRRDPRRDRQADARRSRQEMRLHPSTYRTASLGGFIAGGSGGVGSINWGGLRDIGNIFGLRVVTMEAEPRVLELTGRGPPQGDARLRHQRHHHRGRDAARRRLRLGRRDRRLRRLHATRCASPTQLAQCRTACSSRRSPPSPRRSPHDYFLRHQKFLPPRAVGGRC